MRGVVREISAHCHHKHRTRHGSGPVDAVNRTAQPQFAPQMAPRHPPAVAQLPGWAGGGDGACRCSDLVSMIGSAPARTYPRPARNASFLRTGPVAHRPVSPRPTVYQEADMARYLVVAHETVTSPELMKQVRLMREQDSDAEFVLLVPATPIRHLLYRRGDEHDAEAAARKRVHRARAHFAKQACRSVTPVSAPPIRGRRSTRRLQPTPATPGSSSPPSRPRSPGGCEWTCRGASAEVRPARVPRRGRSGVLARGPTGRLIHRPQRRIVR